MTDEELTAIYNEANGITGRRLPITTQRIFAAMRATHVAAFRDGYEKGVAAFHEAVAMEREACAKICDDEVQSWLASYAEGSESRGYEVEALKRAAQRMRSNVQLEEAELLAAKAPSRSEGSTT